MNIDVSPTYPACYGIDNVVSVAYTTRTDGLGSLSNYGATHGRLNLKQALNPPIWLASVTSANAGAFQLHLFTGANRECVIQMSTNLSSWTSIYTNLTSTNGTFDFTNLIGSPRQFFRAVATP